MSLFWILLELYDGGGGDNWSRKTCKAQVKSSPPTNQQLALLPQKVNSIVGPILSAKAAAKLAICTFQRCPYTTTVNNSFTKFWVSIAIKKI